MKRFKGSNFPWRLSNSYGIWGEETGHRIAQVDATYDIGQPSRDGKFNAILIASAPELLENLIRLVDRMEENDMGHVSSVRRAKECINKALGI